MPCCHRVDFFCNYLLFITYFLLAIYCVHASHHSPHLFQSTVRWVMAFFWYIMSFSVITYVLSTYIIQTFWVDCLYRRLAPVTIMECMMQSYVEYIILSDFNVWETCVWWRGVWTSRRRHHSIEIATVNLSVVDDDIQWHHPVWLNNSKGLYSHSLPHDCVCGSMVQSSRVC